MKFCSTLGAVLLPFIAATAGGIEFDPEDEGAHWDCQVAELFQLTLNSVYSQRYQAVCIWLDVAL